MKYRRKVLFGDLESRLKELLNEIAKDKGFEIKSFEVTLDHVHVFVTAHPKYSPSYMYKMLKAISARKLLLEFPSLKNKLWKGRLWNPATYVETIGHIVSQHEKLTP